MGLQEQKGALIYVSDTHSLYWYLTNAKKLGRKAHAAFAAADAGLAYIYISAISLAEIANILRNKQAVHGLRALMPRIEALRTLEIVPIDIELVLMAEDLSQSN